jgi:hypothetical protein
MRITEGELRERFGYSPNPDRAHAAAQADVHRRLLQVAVVMSNVLPQGREATLVITKLEEALFWADAAIARTEHLPVRRGRPPREIIDQPLPEN